MIVQTTGFRSIKASLYQVLHRHDSKRTAENSATDKRTERDSKYGTRTVRRHDQRNTSDKNSAYAALISNISERLRARYVEQFDDILRTFINEMNKFENRFGKTRDEEKMLAVKKLMPERLLNYRFRRTTMSHRELHHCCWRTSSLTR